MTKIVLHNGLTVECLPVPRQALDIVWRRMSAAEPAFNPETPEGQAAAVDFSHRVQGVAYLLAFPEVAVPAGWEFPAGLSYAGVKPRSGPEGLRADYIEFGLLAHPADWQRAQDVMGWGVEMETEAGIDAAAATFRPDR